MNQEIDKVLVHWGEQKRRHGDGGALPCALGAAVDWLGSPPRSAPTSRPLVAGAGMDLVAEHVEAVIADLQRQGVAAEEAAERTGKPRRAVEFELTRLASARYLTAERPSVALQLKMAGISSRRTYDVRLAELHQRVLEGLRQRMGRRAA